MPYLILKIDPSVQLSANWLKSLEATDSTFTDVYTELVTDTSPQENGRLRPDTDTYTKSSAQFTPMDEQRVVDFAKKNNLSISFLFKGSSPRAIADFQRYYRLNRPDGVNYLNYFRLSNPKGEIPPETERRKLVDVQGVTYLEAQPDDERVPLTHHPNANKPVSGQPRTISLLARLIRFIVAIVRVIIRVIFTLFRSGPAPIAPPPISSCQNYMQELGIDQAWLRPQPGTGQDVRLAIIDHQWMRNITPLYTIPPANYPNPNPDGATDHGTNTLGVLLPRFSVPSRPYVGLVPKTDVYLSTVDGPNGIQDNHSALLNAKLNASGPIVTDKTGVILVQIGTSAGQLPLENQNSTIFDIIKCATSAPVSIAVVEAAGNGTSTINTTTDSGAIMIGSTNYPTPPAVNHRYTRRANSNSGPRIDVFVWGDQIRTVVNVGPTPATFTDTSAASTIVAGIVCSLQSIARAQYGKVIPPGELRNWLRAVNQPMGTGAATTYKMPLMADLLVKLDAYCTTH
ncbi:hypothetical protein J2I47_05070 [Fibrella sp. HMF5335]|uniref:Subtilase family protein n=1 Tax=Fibrella rubiginis TaxID=2817060 RepID=A0A939GG68_9BACT|nr:hypothetical protein [Fibrella rubiginis]MBO0935912.1 hypothetical protein [Fibrella rubiginis]